MKYRYLSYLAAMLSIVFSLTACDDDDDGLTITPKNELQNDVIKRTLGPNLVGLNIEFAYAMAIPKSLGKLVSAQV